MLLYASSITKYCTDRSASLKKVKIPLVIRRLNSNRLLQFQVSDMSIKSMIRLILLIVHLRTYVMQECFDFVTKMKSSSV